MRVFALAKFLAKFSRPFFTKVIFGYFFGYFCLNFGEILTKSSGHTGSLVKCMTMATVNPIMA